VLGGAVILGLAAGMAGGGWCAAHPRNPGARMLEVLAVVGMCAPAYVVGLSVLLLLGDQIGVLEIGVPLEYDRPTENPARWLGSILAPWIVLALPLAGLSLRAMRGGMLEVMEEDYVRAATAKGRPRRVILRRHVAPVAAGSTLALAGATTNLVMLTNLVLVERVFRVPGAFAATQPALVRGDFPLLLGLVIVGTGVVVAASVLVDLALGWLDPRVRLG
jgi:peptide/nickel transport system permease protein